MLGTWANPTWPPIVIRPTRSESAAALHMLMCRLLRYEPDVVERIGDLINQIRLRRSALAAWSPAKQQMLSRLIGPPRPFVQRHLFERLVLEWELAFAMFVESGTTAGAVLWWLHHDRGAGARDAMDRFIANTAVHNRVHGYVPPKYVTDALLRMLDSPYRLFQTALPATYDLIIVDG